MKEPSLARVAGLVAYDGARYNGWTDVRDGHLRPALATALAHAVDEPPPLVHAASRTDKGVHALANLCAFDAPPPAVANLPKLCYSLNQLMPPDLHLRGLAHVDPAFDPRDNVGKEYRYAVTTRRDPLRRRDSWYVAQRHGSAAWDARRAATAARTLLGTHAFGAFANAPRGSARKAAASVSPECTVQMLQLRQLGHHEYEFRVRGDRFLYKMVRNIVGALVQVGLGELGEEAISAALTDGEEFAGTKPLTAPAHGLRLHRVLLAHELFPEAQPRRAGLRPWRARTIVGGPLYEQPPGAVRLSSGHLAI